MIVRTMSAHQTRFSELSTAVQNNKLNQNARFWAAPSSPKAEVGRSNRLGRATKSVT